MSGNNVITFRKKNITKLEVERERVDMLKKKKRNRLEKQIYVTQKLKGRSMERKAEWGKRSRQNEESRVTERKRERETERAKERGER